MSNKKERKAFQFKQFKLRHSINGLPLTQDSCVLAALVEYSTNAIDVLDVGCGTAVLSLMLAQRQSSLYIDGIDINEEDVAVGSLNVADSPWSDRIKLFTKSLYECDETKLYDLIVSNPPFHIEAIASPSPSKALARTQTKNGLLKWVRHCMKLLKQDGVAYFMLSTSFWRSNMQEILEGSSCFLKHEIIIKNSSQHESKRCIVALCLDKSSTIKEEEFLVYNEKKDYSDSFVEKLSPFYTFL